MPSLWVQIQVNSTVSGEEYVLKSSLKVSDVTETLILEEEALSNRTFLQSCFVFILPHFIRRGSKLSHRNLFFLPCVFEAQREFQPSCSKAEGTDVNEEERNVFFPHEQFYLNGGKLKLYSKHLFTLYVVFVKSLRDLRVHRKGSFQELIENELLMQYFCVRKGENVACATVCKFLCV